MFEHMPTQCYNLPKLQAPLTITVIPSHSLKRKKEDEEEIDDHDENNSLIITPCIQRQSRYSTGVYSSPTKIHYPSHQTDCTIIPTHSSQIPTTEEGQPKKLKQYHEQTNECSTTVASSSLIMNSPFQLFYKPQLTDPWFSKFNMEECVMNFNRYVDDMHDVNVIKMSPQEYFNCCYDFSSSFNGSGLLRLYRDLGFKSFFDYRYFIFVFLFNFNTKLSISRSEWTFGMFNLQCDNVQKLRYQIDKVAEESKTWNNDQMKNLFTVTFKILRESEKSRSIDATVAGYALKVLMTGRSPFTESFSNFLISSNNPIRSINLDQWKIFVDFSSNISANLSNYDSNDAWPSLYDNYLSCSFGLKY